MKKAMYFSREESGLVQCHLCPRECLIRPDKIGNCRVRKNINGDLYSINYGQYTAIAVDPIEKKPLTRFHPGTNILSIGTFGCNFHCGYCQNWQIAHAATKGRPITPEELTAKAKEAVKLDSIGVAYTYSEPMVWYEFVLDSAKLIQHAGLKNVLVTNGFVKPEPFKELLPYIDALNIDIKGFTENFYKSVVYGELNPVLETALLAHQAGKHIEITTLLIPGLNDGPDEIEKLTSWMAEKLSPEVPIHLSRYYPNYQFDKQPTPLKNMYLAQEAASRHLKYVYLGNV